MKKLIYLFLFFSSLSNYSQVIDSVSINLNATQKELIKESSSFYETKSQESRDILYYDEIQKNEKTLDQQNVTKEQIDFKLNDLMIRSMNIVVSPTEATQTLIKSIIISPIESTVAPLSVIESPVEVKQDVLSIVDDLQKNKKRLKGPSDYDSRLELLQLNPSINWQLAIFEKSNSVAMIIEKEKINQVSADIFALDISNISGKIYNLCPKEFFYNQPCVGVGTSFIISENTMLTAKHVFEKPLTDYVVVFGYRIVQANGVVENLFDKKDIYYPKKIIHNNDELDALEFSVDRNFDRPILQWENSSDVFNSKQNEIYMLGHPLGLPMKVAVNATIDNNNHPFYYYTTLDGFQGNSGSPVFNFYTNKVIGVLVAGEIDFKFNGNCYNSTTCTLPYCKGEKVIRIEEIMNRFEK